MQIFGMGIGHKNQFIRNHPGISLGGDVMDIDLNGPDIHAEEVEEVEDKEDAENQDKGIERKDEEDEDEDEDEEDEQEDEEKDEEEDEDEDEYESDIGYDNF